MYLCVFFLRALANFTCILIEQCQWYATVHVNFILNYLLHVSCVWFFFLEWWRNKYTFALPAFVWTDISIFRCMSCWGKLHTTELWPRQSVTRDHLVATVCSDWRSRGSTSTLRRPAQVGGTSNTENIYPQTCTGILVQV